MKVRLVTPAGARSRNGNRVTAERWARLLRGLGHEVKIEETWSGGHADVLISLHARRGHQSVTRFAREHPGLPIVVVLTGTDLYRDVRSDKDAKESLELATRLVVLQEAGLDELSPRHREKACVIHQSAEPLRSHTPAKTFFDVCVIGHLRPEKDPFRSALAADLLPPASRVRVTHAGGERSDGFARRAEELAASVPRYRWLGDVPRWRTRELLSRARLLVQSSVMEGGANTVSEALVAGVPVLASRIPGNVGMLGDDYPGYYPAGDEEALAGLLRRAETDPVFYASLQERCATRAPLFEPARERAALAELLEELFEGREAS